MKWQCAEDRFYDTFMIKLIHLKMDQPYDFEYKFSEIFNIILSSFSQGWNM